ncbi:DUF5132 domain-containing protein [Methylobacter sp.]|uniref:DUF5132 domain-containing protein n=1 Tax=Methylobacter sp. TaxID=2051955 RepID=UPI002FDE2A61
MKIDDFTKTGTPLGIAIGIGATVLATAVIPALPALARAARPTIRAAIKSGILLAEKGRELMSETSEELEDIFAEARAELLSESEIDQTEPAEHGEPSTHKEDL